MAKDKIVEAQAFELAPLEIGMSEVKDLIEANIGTEDVSAFDLERAINPQAGSTEWKIPGIEEEPERTDTIEGIIVHHKFIRVYYEGEYKGGGDPPTCFSEDGIRGEGNPGGYCAECPFSQWGSGKNDGQACRAVKQLFIQRSGSLLPTLVQISPVNIKHPKFFLMQLLNKLRIPAHAILTRIKLVADKSKKSGYEYARTDFTMVRRLDDKERAAAEELHKIWKPMLDQRSGLIDVTPDAIDEDPIQEPEF